VELRKTEPQTIENLNSSIHGIGNSESIWRILQRYGYLHSIIFFIKAWENDEKLIQ
jgi:hypothetical protein